ncbi:hypothetical protein [Rhizobium laguerreae]|uniref:hypothetical protein n=1 Tax=Rhizobium laguerreae TaxID=1076926 RepID=UPI001FE747D0|nr:hypothetical protein [Rhizobium laguerreae]
MATIVVPYFDDAEVELAQEADRDDAKSIVALNAFLALTSADREADSRHVFACYKDFYAGTGEPNGWMRKWGFLHPLLRFGTASGPDRSPSGRAGGTMTTGTS